MIALNELMENKSIFEERYKFLDCEDKIEKIIELEYERKILQLQYEKLRSDMNKLCHELAINKSQNQNLDEIFNTIISNEKELNFEEKKLNKLNKIINQKLNKLPNLPDEILEENKVISKNKISLNSQELKQFIQNNFINDYVVNSKNNEKLKSKDCLKEYSNYIFEDNQILMIDSNNGLVILLSHIKFNDYIQKIFDYLKHNSAKFWQLKTKSMSSSSANEYKAKFDDTIVKIEIKNEFYTRKYNIKYKNSLEDMTRFLKQINIKF